MCDTANEWEDAICINPKDDKEKSNQVPQIGKACKAIRHTIIYLGEATAETTYVLEGIRAQAAMPSRKELP